MENPRPVRRFERQFAAWLGAEHAFAFWKGRVAMYAILKAMGIGAGDEVILPGYTCVRDVNPIKYLGARPVYVDIEPVTYNLDVDLLERHISPRTRVIIAQHTYGYPCRMDRLCEIAADHKVPVVEDCCLAVGSSYAGRRCGTWGLAAYWSFQWNKAFTTGLGGMATTRDAQLAQRISELCRTERIAPSAKEATMLTLQRAAHRAVTFPRTVSLITRLFRYLTRKGLVIGSSSAAEFVPVMAAGFFKGMSAGQGRAGLAGAHRLEGNIAHRRDIAKLYDQLLAQAGWPVPAGMAPVLVRYPVRVGNKAELVAQAPRRGVEIGTWFECPLHPIETPLERYDYTLGSCPLAEQAAREVVNLPTHPRTGAAAAKRCVRFLQEEGLKGSASGGNHVQGRTA